MRQIAAAYCGRLAPLGCQLAGIIGSKMTGPSLTPLFLGFPPHRPGQSGAEYPNSRIRGATCDHKVRTHREWRSDRDGKCVGDFSSQSASKQLCIVQARTEFHAFRKVIRPKMQWCWWVEMLCLELQQFYEDFAGCCAPAPSGHVAAVLPRSVMNSRRFIRSNAFAPAPHSQCYLVNREPGSFQVG